MTTVIRPRLAEWDFAGREAALWGSVKEIPTWRLAHQSRRMLADVLRQLTTPEMMPTPEVDQVIDLDATTAARLACTQLSALVVRSTGAILSLIACGYETEALAPARTSVEAVLRARQINDDASGQAARKILLGRRPGSLKAIAHRYGQAEDVDFLDRFAHADVRGLKLKAAFRGDAAGSEPDLNLLPTRGLVVPANQLLSASRHAVESGVTAIQAFGATLEVPPWISAQLLHYRDNPLPPNL